MDILEKYAQLLVGYCLEVNAKDRVLIRTTTLAEPLVRSVYTEILKAGGHPHVMFSFAEQNALFHQYANDDQLSYVDPTIELGLTSFEKYLYIMAPHNLSEDQGIDPSRRKISQQATKSIMNTYSQRTADGSMNRNLCLFPTQASAQEAGMTLSAYERFVYTACNLYDDNPVAAWLHRRQQQQQIVDYLHTKSVIRYVNDRTDISFSTAGRRWINSDGRTNMPSGEVYTSPVEDSVNGYIYFDYPAIFRGKEVQGINLVVRNGYIEEWSADKGQDVLDQAFLEEGARYFGEAAIGTNYNIQTFTKNILFDEKIGGTIHMAIGQSYLQAGGKNQSTIHWDMIANMSNDGKLYADEELFYQNGKFLFLKKN